MILILSVLFVTINVGTVLIIQIIVPHAVIVIDPLNPVAYVIQHITTMEPM
jgi:hypothetical protein